MVLMLVCTMSQGVVIAANHINDDAGNVGGVNDDRGNVGGVNDDTGNRQGTGDGRGVSVKNPLKAQSITAFFIDLIEVVLVFATPVIVFFIILAGFKYVLARGNPEKVSEASKALLFAVIGGLLILGAFVILNVIQGTINAITV